MDRIYRFVTIALILCCGICNSCTTKPISESREAGCDPGSNHRKGIDVSHHQGVINWEKVRQSAAANDIGFVYIKATEGSNWVDPQFKNNLQGARHAGLKVGAYHFLSDKSSGEQQFKHFKETVPRDDIDLIPLLDVEIDKSRTKWSRSQVQKAVDAFIKGCVDYYGCLPMIYGTQRSYNTWLAPSYNKYHLMIGRYGPNSPIILGKGSWSIWQYTQTGKLKGIPKSVDIDVINDKYTLSDFLID